MRALLLLVILLLIPQFGAAQDAAFPRPFCIPANFVTTTRAFLRATPSSQSQAVGVVPAGEQVLKLRQVQGESLTVGGGTSDLWYLVNFRDEYGIVSEGYLWSRLLEVVSEDDTMQIITPEFRSTVEDTIGNIFELRALRIETQALLDTSTLYEPLQHQLIALRQSDAVMRLIWLPLVERLRRVDDVTVEVALYSGDTVSGTWARSLPIKYPTETTAEFLLGEPTDGASRQTVSLPHTSVQTMANEVAPERQAAFQAMVNCYLSTLVATARPVEIAVQSGDSIRGIFGYLVDGGGAYARYTWRASRDLLLWPGEAERCESPLNGYPAANVIAFADMASLTITDTFGDCGGRVVQAAGTDGTTVDGALVSRDESFSGNWLYGANLGDDYVIVFTPYGADMTPLSIIASLTFAD